MSVYGVGLKRAIFKLGRVIKVESYTEEDGFVVDIDVDDWSRPENEDNWTFPIEKQMQAKTEGSAGTCIVVSNLNSEVVMRLNDGTLLMKLKQMIASTYPLFLEKYVSVTINNIPVTPLPMTVTAGEGVETSSLRFEEDDVKVIITAGLAEKLGGEWNQDRAGWYIVCNGRVVVWADKTELTGWGSVGPQFHTKFRGFMGLVFFFSDSPEYSPMDNHKTRFEQRIENISDCHKENGSCWPAGAGFPKPTLSRGNAEEMLEPELFDNLKPVPLSKFFEPKIGTSEWRER